MKKFTLALILSLTTVIAGFSQTTRYWVGGGTAYGNDGTKWSLTSGGTPIGGTITWQTNDIAIFDVNSGSGIVVLINAIGTIGELKIYGNQTVTVKCDGAANRTLNLNTASSETFYLEVGSTFIIVGASNGYNLNINMNNGTTARIDGYLRVTDDNTGYGALTKSSTGTIIFRNGSTYEHNSKESGSNVPVANWNSGSTCLITGVTGSRPGNLNQVFHHFTWNCPNQSSNISLACNLTHVNGNLTILSTNYRYLRFSNGSNCSINIGGNFNIGSSASYFMIADNGGDVAVTVNGSFSMTAGDFTMSANSSDSRYVSMTVNGNFTLQNTYFRLATGASNSTLNLKSNFTMSGGWFIANTSGDLGNVYFNGNKVQTYSKTGGTILNRVNCTVTSGTTLDMGNSVWGDNTNTTGSFTLQSGATLRTTHSQGITSSGASGCIQNNGSRSFHAVAHYQFYTNGSQSTGNGLPSSPAGNVTIGSAANTTNLSFSNLTTIGGSLIIVKGTVATSNISYGSAGILEYGGNAPQTMGNNEWPSSTVPNLKINNGSGVTMNAGKTVSNNLNLQSGTLNIGSNNTLTLHNSTISVNSGTLTGGSLSNIVLSGSGNTTLPDVINGLNNLTINRPGAAITIGGAVNVTGTLAMTAGACTLGAGSITYGPSAILLYNGAATQATGSAELPASNQPAQITFQNPTQVNLHENRSFSGTISLESGNFNIGNHQFTFDGYFQQTGGSVGSGTTGQLNFAENSNPTILPSGSAIATVTINRSGGINLAGNATVNSNLILENGNFTIGANQLTLNGLITQNSGTMTGGNESSIYFGGSGASTTLPAIILSNLTVNRANGIVLGGDVTIYNQLFTQAGTLNIGNNTLYINGTMKTLGGSLAGRTLQINESDKKVSTDLPTANLNYLLIYRTDGVKMKGNVTVNNELSIFTGSLSIGQYNTLALYGSLFENIGELLSEKESNLTIGGDGGAIDLHLSDLLNFSLYRTAGIKLNKSLTIWGTFSLANSAITLNDNKILYGSNGSLSYIGLAPQSTTSSEWPDSNGPRNVSIQNFSGVSLHDDRKIDGDLNLNFGSFEIGTHTLTLNGRINITSGSMTGGENSNIVAGNSLLIMPLYLPEITLNNLLVDRMSGVHLAGNLDLYGNLTLTTGELHVSNNTLTLRKPIAGNLNNLKTLSLSNLIIAGNVAGLNIGPSENIRITDLNSLTISNQHENGVALNGQLYLEGNLALNTGSKFIANPESWLTIRRNMLITDEESLILKSTATSTASLILFGEQTRSGSVRVERYIKGYTSNNNGWYLFGSPIADFLIAGSSFHPGSGDDLFIYSEPYNMWLNYKVPGNFTHFQAGTGYLLASHVTASKWVSGMINNNDFSFAHLSLTNNGGWHLPGNPYPSALRWNDGHWHLEGINHLAKLWKESIHNYIDLDPGNHIPAHNGFFIRVNNVNNKLTIPLLSREHSNSPWHKNTDLPTLSLTSQSVENNTATICRIRFHEEASPGFDNLYDAHYLAGFPQPPMFYSKTACGEILSTNTLPFSEETTVQLHFAKGVSGSYQIEADGVSSFPVGVKIVLKDNLLNIPVDLTIQSSYYFSSKPEDNPERFTLHFSNLTGVEEFHSTSEPTFFFSDGKIQILNLDVNSNKPALIEILDLTGRVLLKMPAPSDGIVTCPELGKGIYLIRLTFFDTGRYLSSKIINL